MKKFLFLIVSLFLLPGCAQNKKSVDKPFEIVKGTSKLSYYDTEDNIDIDNFEILEPTAENILGRKSYDSNCIIVKDGKIRSIFIADKDIETYKQISVGDSVEKIEDAFQYEFKAAAFCSVMFDGTEEVENAGQNKEDDWIEITYYVEDSEITSIEIADVKFYSKLQ